MKDSERFTNLYHLLCSEPISFDSLMKEGKKAFPDAISRWLVTTDGNIIVQCCLHPEGDCNVVKYDVPGQEVRTNVEFSLTEALISINDLIECIGVHRFPSDSEMQEFIKLAALATIMIGTLSSQDEVLQ